MMPEDNIFSLWFSFIVLVAFVVIGIFVFKWLSDIMVTHLKYNHKSRKKVNRVIDWVYNLPYPIKTTGKVLGTIIYIGVCVIVIAYASN